MKKKSSLSKRMDLQKVEYLLSNPLDAKNGNCFLACLFVHNLAKIKDNITEDSFLQILKSEFDKIDTVVDLQKGDILCMCYNNFTSCQHAFIYWDESNVFQKSGPFPYQTYNLQGIVHTVCPYSSKQIALLCRNIKDDISSVPVTRFLEINPQNCVFRRKVKVQSQKIKHCIIN